MSELLLSLLAHAAIEPHSDARRRAWPAAGRVMLGPGALMGAVGLLAPGARPVGPPVPAAPAIVDVAIPLGRDQASIVYCLAGLHAQRLRPRRIVFVDGGAERDGTLVLAREFAAANGFAIGLQLVAPDAGLSALARLFDGDALLVLDGGTVLDSPDYLERCLQVMHADVGAAGVSGMALPLRDEDRRAWARCDAFRRWVGNDEYRDPCAPRSDLQRVGRWVADAYRESVALVQQCFARREPMDWSGRAAPPAGAVLYRREVLERDGSVATPVQGAGRGLRADRALGGARFWTVQRPEMRARTLPAMLAGPGRATAEQARPDLPRDPRPGDGQAAVRGVRSEPVPVPGRATGLRPAQALLLPALAGALLAVGGWPWLAGVALVELVLWLLVLGLVAPARPLATLGRGLLVAPLRYVEIAVDAAGALRGLVVRPR